MFRAILTCSVLLCPGFIPRGQAQTDIGTGSPLQIVYLQHSNTLTTYHIHPNALTASQVGGPFPLPMFSFNSLASSLNGKFLYILGNDAGNNQNIWVFPTGDDGEPRAPAIQTLEANGLYNFSLDPALNFAYALVGSFNSQGQSFYEIQRFALDPATGKLSSPIVAAIYPVNGPCQSGGAGGAPYLDGFSPDGKALYDNWFCNYPASTTAIYYERGVNSQTGALSREVEVYTWDDGTQGYDTIFFSHDHILDYNAPNGNGQGNSLNIFPLVPKSTQAVIQCTSEMLPICGNALGAIVDPSGKYIFFVNSSYGDEIAQIDMANRRLIDTGQSLPAQVTKFAPGGFIAYTLNISGISYYLQIYGFDPSIGGLTTNGGTIAAPSNSDTFWPVLRQ